MNTEYKSSNLLIDIEPDDPALQASSSASIDFQGRKLTDETHSKSSAKDVFFQIFKKPIKSTVDGFKYITSNAPMPFGGSSSTSPNSFLVTAGAAVFNKLAVGVSKGVVWWAGDYEKQFKDKVAEAKSIIQQCATSSLQTTIENLIPELSTKLFKSIEQNIDLKFVLDIYTDQSDLILKSLKATLYVLIANLAKNSALRLNKTEVNVSDILISINEILGGGCEDLLKDLMNDDLSEDHLQKLIIPFKDKLLYHLFPNGMEDIILPKGIIIDSLKREIFNTIGGFLPNLAKDFFREMKKNAKFVERNIQKQIEANDFNEISKKSGSIAHVVVDLLKSHKFSITEDAETQALLDSELETFINDPSFENSTLDFAQKAIQLLIERVIGTHVIAYNKSHRYDADSKLDTMTKFSIQMIDLLDKYAVKLDKNYFDEFKDLNENNREFLISEIQPLLIKVLKASGFSSAYSIPLPEKYRVKVWELLTETLLPNLIIDQIHKVMALNVDLSPKVAALENAEQFDHFIKACCKKALPVAQQKIQENSAEYTKAIVAFGVLPDVFDASTVENMLGVVAEAKEQSVKNVLTYIPDVLSQFVNPLLLNFASTDTSKSKDILKNIANNLRKLIQKKYQDSSDNNPDLKFFEEFGALILNQEDTHFDRIDLKDENYKKMLKSYYGQSFLDNVESLDENAQKIMLEIYFGSPVDDLIKQMGIPKENIPKEVRQYLLKVSYKIFNLFNKPLDQQKEYQKALYEMLGINAESLDDVNRLQNQSTDYPVIENAINMSAEMIQDKIKAYVISNPNNLLDDLKLDATTKKWFGHSFKGLMRSRVMGDVWNYSSNILKATITKVFIDVSAQPKDGDKPLNLKDVLPHFLSRVSGLLKTDIKSDYKKIMKLNDIDERQAKLRELFTPLAKELLTLAGSNLLETYPLPVSLKNTLLSNLEQQILPDVLANLYTDTTAWHVDSDDDELKLVHLFLKDRPQVPLATAKVIARLTSDFIPAYLGNTKNKVAVVLKNKLIDFMLKQSGSNAEALQEYLKVNGKEVRRIFRSNLKDLTEVNIDFLKNVTPGIERYVEVAILRIMSNLFENINRIQKKDDFYIDLGLKLLDISNQHFAKLVALMKDNKNDIKDVAYDIDPKVLKDKYDLFHPALIETKDSSPRSKSEKEKVEFYVPFASKILSLANVTRDSLPVPEALKDQFHDLLNNQLGPLLLEKIMESIDVDKILLSMLKSLNTESATVSNDKVHKMQKDPAQTTINNACGDLFLNLIRLIPSPGVQKVFEIALKNTTSEALGFLFRTQLTEVNFTKVISDSLAKLMVNLNDQVMLDDQGNLIVPDSLGFDFPKTPQESLAKEAKDLKDKKITQALLIEELSKTVGIQIANRISNFFSEPWRKFQKKLDEWLIKVFGEKAIDFKQKIHSYLENVFINILLGLLYVVTLPAWMIVQRILLKKAKDVTKTLHMDIHKNLVFNLVDATLQYLKDIEEEQLKRNASDASIPDQGVFNL